ncbi:ferredoxin [Granulicatella sp. zg-ZJ]|uniref:ferredoxin n=1 Tax=unclassified Granulicatella TaxID=2630493 RepID=UPI0013C106E3|nr:MULTISPECIES: ferredoxin [unclassified Granulicatella]MBS4750675.1 ferredoxin [Carnobacteriaceae bacterium zg-ZUI78]NEW63438.1 ferredoxin [Granulicatella sp. zg-ZJ]NEW66451.1 ferredoxin [Granulicatella sp. zg-84]QMI86345.1 ferredoxin [Carnobacteriaceae bacterium zg-84]
MFYDVCQEDCIACGLCQLKAPKLFYYDDEGIAHSLYDRQTHIPESLMFSFKDAYINCPTGAIKRFDK